MSDEVTQVAAGTGLVVGGQVRDPPGDVQVADVLHWDDVGDGGALGGTEGWGHPLGNIHSLVLHLAEPLQCHLLQRASITIGGQTNGRDG